MHQAVALQEKLQLLMPQTIHFQYIKGAMPLSPMVVHLDYTDSDVFGANSDLKLSNCFGLPFLTLRLDCVCMLAYYYVVPSNNYYHT